MPIKYIKDSIELLEKLRQLSPVLRFVVLAVIIIGGPLWLILGLLSIPYIVLVSALSAVGGAFVNRRQVIRKERRWKKSGQASVEEKTRLLSVGRDPDRKRIDVHSYFVEPHLALSSDYTQEVHERRTPYQVMEYANSMKQHGVIIWGLTGTGKSTLAQWLACEIAGSKKPENWSFLRRDRGNTAKYPEWLERFIIALGLETEGEIRRFPVPVFVHLQPGSSVKGNERPKADVIERLLHEHLQSPRCENLQSPEELRRWLKRGMIIPVFDGLDELAQEAQAVLLEALGDFYNQFPGNFPFVLTTCFPDITLPSSIATSRWRILPFNERQIQRYARRYFKGNGDAGKRESKPGEEFWQAIQKVADVAPRIWDIVSNPMLLAMLATSFATNAEEQLPTNRAAVYRTYIEELCRPSRVGRHRDTDQGIIENLAYLSYKSLSSPGSTLQERDVLHPEMLEGKVLYRTPYGSLSFAHQMLQVYFASQFLCEQLRSRRGSERRELWEKAIETGCDGSQSADTRERFWRMNWREVLAFAVSTLADESQLHTPSAPEDTTWLVQDIEWSLHRFRELPFRILLLRLISIAQVHKELPLQQGKALLWLKRFHPAPPDWWRDIWEASYVLDDPDWDRLKGETDQLTARQDTVLFLSSLGHERAAEILVNLSVDLAQETGMVLDELKKAVHRLGIVVAPYLVQSFRRADDEASRTALITLMGEAGYTHLTNQILCEVADGTHMSEELSAAAFQAWAQWGSDGTSQLWQHMKNIKDVSAYLQDALLRALAKLVMDRSFAETKIIALLSDESKEKRRLAIQLIQAKLNAQTDDMTIFAEHLEAGLQKYKPRSLRHRVLGYLEKRQLGRTHSSGPGKDRDGALYAWLASRGGPSPEFVRTALQIYAEAEGESYANRIKVAVSDHCLSIRSAAIEALARRSLRFARIDPLQWLDEAGSDLPEDSVRQVRERVRELGGEKT